MEQASDNLDWHTAFRAAIKLEFEDYLDSLTFINEYVLNTQPLAIDTLIIKKKPDVIINKALGKIFRTVNILEYKSPSDYVSVRVFLKGCSYVGVYLSQNPAVNPDDITLTIIESRYPRELFKYLDAKNCKILNESPGIYCISGLLFPVQLIVSTELDESSNFWLKELRSGADFTAAEQVLDKHKKEAALNEYKVYLDIFIRANKEIFLEVMKMKYPTMEEILTEAGFVQKWTQVGYNEAESKFKTQLSTMGSQLSNMSSQLSTLGSQLSAKDAEIARLKQQLAQKQAQPSSPR
jgi:hypothetical protein